MRRERKAKLMEFKITIRTNRHWRNLTYGYELTARERSDFDYIDADDFDSHDFIRYRGRVYDIDEFTATDQFPGWEGCLSDSFFSGIVIRLDHETRDRVQVGAYYA